MRRNASYEKDKLVLAERATQTYQGAVGTALQLYQKQQNQKYLRQAFYFSEQNKASVLAGALADHRAQQFAGIPDSLISLEKELKSIEPITLENLPEKKTVPYIVITKINSFKPISGWIASSY